MSAKVQCAHSDGINLRIGTLDGYPGAPRIYVQLFAGGAEKGLVNPTRADFLAAVSSELGVVIVDKADLPEVAGYNATHDLVGVIALSKSSDPAALRREAFRYLAYAEHLEADPPVDEALVSALAEIVRAATGTPLNAYIGADLTAEGIARSLIATGKVEVRS